MQRDGALAIAIGRSHALAVSRAARPFSPVERDLLEHLAAQAAVSLENLRLEELMRRTSAELRAILEGVADAVAAEDPKAIWSTSTRPRSGCWAGRTSSARGSGSPPTCCRGGVCSRARRPIRWSFATRASRAGRA